MGVRRSFAKTSRDLVLIDDPLVNYHSGNELVASVANAGEKVSGPHSDPVKSSSFKEDVATGPDPETNKFATAGIPKVENTVTSTKSKTIVAANSKKFGRNTKFFAKLFKKIFFFFKNFHRIAKFALQLLLLRAVSTAAWLCYNLENAHSRLLAAVDKILMSELVANDANQNSRPDPRSNCTRFGSSHWLFGSVDSVEGSGGGSSSSGSSWSHVSINADGTFDFAQENPWVRDVFNISSPAVVERLRRKIQPSNTNIVSAAGNNVNTSSESHAVSDEDNPYCQQWRARVEDVYMQYLGLIYEVDFKPVESPGSDNNKQEAKWKLFGSLLKWKTMRSHYRVATANSNNDNYINNRNESGPQFHLIDLWSPLSNIIPDSRFYRVLFQQVILFYRAMELHLQKNTVTGIHGTSGSIKVTDIPDNWTRSPSWLINRFNAVCGIINTIIDAPRIPLPTYSVLSRFLKTYLASTLSNLQRFVKKSVDVVNPDGQFGDSILSVTALITDISITVAESLFSSSDFAYENVISWFVAPIFGQLPMISCDAEQPLVRDHEPLDPLYFEELQDVVLGYEGNGEDDPGITMS